VCDELSKRIWRGRYHRYGWRAHNRKQTSAAAEFIHFVRRYFSVYRARRLTDSGAIISGRVRSYRIINALGARRKRNLFVFGFLPFIVAPINFNEQYSRRIDVCIMYGEGPCSAVATVDNFSAANNARSLGGKRV